MNAHTANNSNRPHWFVCSKREHHSGRLLKFLNKGIWEYFDDDVKENTCEIYQNYLKNVAIGDRIAIYEIGNETPDEFKANHPFEIPGKFITYLEIRAVGEITKPYKVTTSYNDNWTVGVNWTKVSNSKRWYRYTYKGQIWRVYPSSKQWLGKNLIEFTFDGAPQDLGRLYSELYPEAIVVYS